MQSHPGGDEAQKLPGSLAPGQLGSEASVGSMSPWLCQCPILSAGEGSSPAAALFPTVRLDRVSRRVADVSASHPREVTAFGVHHVKGRRSLNLGESQSSLVRCCHSCKKTDDVIQPPEEETLVDTPDILHSGQTCWVPAAQ